MKDVVAADSEALCAQRLPGITYQARARIKPRPQILCIDGPGRDERGCGANTKKIASFHELGLT